MKDDDSSERDDLRREVARPYDRTLMFSDISVLKSQMRMLGMIAIASLGGVISLIILVVAVLIK